LEQGAHRKSQKTFAIVFKETRDGAEISDLVCISKMELEKSVLRGPAENYKLLRRHPNKLKQRKLVRIRQYHKRLRRPPNASITESAAASEEKEQR
jgi:hypothetical protein